MSFVTAAIEYFSRRALQRASIKAVFPEPTGLHSCQWVLCRIDGHLDIINREMVLVSTARDYPALEGMDSERNERRFIPSDSNSKSTFRPVSSLNDWHLSAHVTSRSIKNFVGVAVIGSGEIVRVAMRSMEVDTIVGMHSRHDGQVSL